FQVGSAESVTRLLHGKTRPHALQVFLVTALSSLVARQVIRCQTRIHYREARQQLDELFATKEMRQSDVRKMNLRRAVGEIQRAGIIGNLFLSFLNKSRVTNVQHVTDKNAARFEHTSYFRECLL